LERMLYATIELLFFSVVAFFTSISFSVVWAAVSAEILIFGLIGTMVFCISSGNKMERYELGTCFYDAVAKYELKNRTRILPDDMNPDNGILYITWMFRDRPLMSKRDWLKAKIALWMDCNFLKLFFTMVALPMAFGVLYRVGAIHVPQWTGLAAIFVPFSVLYHFIFWHQLWRQIVFNIADYERLTGERLIPDDVRTFYDAAKAEQDRLVAVRKGQQIINERMRQKEPPVEKIRQWKREMSR
jgi:hypothetical protein